MSNVTTLNNPLMQPIQYNGQTYFTGQYFHQVYFEKGLFPGDHYNFICSLMSLNAARLAMSYSLILPINNGLIDNEFIENNKYTGAYLVDTFAEQGRALTAKIEGVIPLTFSYFNGFDLFINQSVEIFMRLSWLKPLSKSSKWSDEDSFFELLSAALPEEEIIRQHSINKYRIDFFFPKYYLCVEYDEKHHKYKSADDSYRQQSILRSNPFNFIRVTQGKEGFGIMKIHEFLMNIKTK